MSRGGVEDKRLKAMDIKKIEAQEQPLRGQTLSRPRTQAQVFSKKKRSSKFFSGDLQNFKNSKKKCCPRVEDRANFEELRLRE